MTGTGQRNVFGTERVASAAGGIGLLALAARRGAAGPRLLMALAGAALAARGLTGYCAVRAELERRAHPQGRGSEPVRPIRMPPPGPAAARFEDRERRNPGDILDEAEDCVDQASKESFPA
ncbi:MAG TPA: YgaP-like transmembrane domain, partial [Alphaproteobacteria bacterium]|nr:YgaP-like transmembrane domain [Alphaproteobacteria bacterium]